MTEVIHMIDVPARSAREIRLRLYGEVVVSYSPVTVSALGKLAQLAPKGAVLDSRAARILNAELVIGLPKDIQALVKQFEGEAIARVRAANPGAGEQEILWLALGEIGASSMALYNALSNRDQGPSSRECPHPLDPSDFRRCELMLDQMPWLRVRLPKMRSMSPTWASLAEVWDQVVSALDEEIPGWRNPDSTPKGQAPKAYSIIQSALRVSE